MLPAFQLGLGGKLGNGKQMVSWVALDDVIYGIYFALLRQELEGPINVTSPFPIQRSDRTEILLLY